MLETPGTMILTIGLLLLLISVIAFAVGAWGAGIGFFFISMILIYIALQLRRHEAAVAAANAAANARYAPHVIKTTELREREIVKIKCRHCGSLNPDGARNCGSCGAPL
jgi:ribosomal protein L40E